MDTIGQWMLRFI